MCVNSYHIDSYFSWYARLGRETSLRICNKQYCNSTKAVIRCTICVEYMLLSFFTVVVFITQYRLARKRGMLPINNVHLLTNSTPNHCDYIRICLLFSEIVYLITLFNIIFFFLLFLFVHLHFETVYRLSLHHSVYLRLFGFKLRISGS